MKISQQGREFAKLENQYSLGCIATDEAEAGMADMSKVYDATGRARYPGRGERDHD